ncbi:hypothetical protein MCOR25_003505 [Pyricularia grisea]|nr:hypothetical protein MCOR25_003505 [Pyricularia grisea]
MRIKRCRSRGERTDMSSSKDPTTVVPAPSWGWGWPHTTYAMEGGVDSGLEDDEEFEQSIEPDDPKIFRDGRAPRDSDVLREIASWLTNSFRNKILLHGIIYLHRISDPRMQGSARKNLMMFKKLCGDDALKKVILATTMWDIVPAETAEARQTELVNTPEFWGYMVSKGSRVFRHHNTIGSARKIIESLIRDRNTMILELQNQMVNEARPLQDTAAGMELQKEFARERKRWERELREAQEGMEEAIRKRDKESEEALLELKTEYAEHIKRLEREHDKLRTDAVQLHQERIVRFKNALKFQEIVRGKYHEESQGYSSDAPTFSYSMVGERYCFTGPVTYW